MRILLISIINSYKYGNTGIDYIAQYLRQDNRDIVDIKYYHNGESIDDIKNNISLKYDFYGCSVFETNYKKFVDLVTFIKEHNKKCIVFFGGQFVTMNYTEILKVNNDIDYYILGDGEKPIKRLIEHYRIKRTTLLEDINIASKIDYENKIKNIEDHTICESAYDYFINDSYYRNSQKTHCMLTKSNNCTGSCSFCVSRKGKIKYKDNALLIKEIKYLSKEFGVKKYFFVDDDIFDIDNDERRECLKSLLIMIQNLHFNIAFSGFAKCKSICNPKNYEVLQKMSEVGFHNLFVGVDAGNETDRILYHKRSTLEEGINSIRILKEVGISPRYGMIFINPYSSIETMKENYRFLVKLNSYNYYHYGGLRVQLLSGTKLFEKVKSDGMLCNDYSFLNTDSYNFCHPEIIPITEFLKNDFIPKLDLIKNQFTTLKKIYELVVHLNVKAKHYAAIVQQYEDIEFEKLRQFFFHLYEENDIDYCKQKSSKFILEMENRSRIYKPIIHELKQIYDQTPIEKDG